MSLTSCVGIPCLQNSVLNCSIVLDFVVYFIGPLRVICNARQPRSGRYVHTTGPAKSMWRRCQAPVGHSHGCGGAGEGLFCICWQPMQVFCSCSISLSVFGHQMKLLTIAFILTIPRCPSCGSGRTWFLNLVGIITRFPHKRHLS